MQENTRGKTISTSSYAHNLFYKLPKSTRNADEKIKIGVFASMEWCTCEKKNNVEKTRRKRERKREMKMRKRNKIKNTRIHILNVVFIHE